jgi:hypothetical protein
VLPTRATTFLDDVRSHHPQRPPFPAAFSGQCPPPTTDDVPRLDPQVRSVASRFGVALPPRDRFLVVKERHPRYYIPTAYFLDWSSPMPVHARKPVGPPPHLQTFLSYDAAPYGHHFPPACMMHLQRDLEHAAAAERANDAPTAVAAGTPTVSATVSAEGAATATAKRTPTAALAENAAAPPHTSASAQQRRAPRIIWLSRAKERVRHMADERLVLDALVAAFGAAAVLVFGVSGLSEYVAVHLN